MLAVAEVAAAEAVDFTGAAPEAVACTPDASMAAQEGSMVAAIATRDEYTPHIRSQVDL
jgi:hypothetical protein